MKLEDEENFMFIIPQYIVLLRVVSCSLRSHQGSELVGPDGLLTSYHFNSFEYILFQLQTYYACVAVKSHSDMSQGKRLGKGHEVVHKEW